MPRAIEIGFEPGREIHRAIGRRHADIAEVTGAISRGNVHARHNVTARCAKSRQTPRLSLNASHAVLVDRASA